jgi:chitinase
MNIKTKLSITLCLSAAMLAGCGGGGNGESAGAPVLAATLVAVAPSCATAWVEGNTYSVGNVVSYNGANYSALVQQTDYAGAGWNPTVASLWQANGACSGGSSAPPPTTTPPPDTTPTTTTPPPSGTPAGSCAPDWSAGTTYNGGDSASRNSVNYQANWWSRGDDPASNSGPSGSGKVWTSLGACGGSGTPPVTPPPIDNPPPPATTGFIFGPYKDVTINMNWNTNVLTTKVTGSAQPVLSVMPAKLTSLTLAFATGECGSENWGGIAGPALASANVAALVKAGKAYVLSTGGASGAFTCGSDAGFSTFIDRYNSANLIGVDFDIEAGQSQADIANLVARVKAAQTKYPALRFSFTLATLAGSSGQSLGAAGVNVMNAIRSAGLSRYVINLMVMDYGSAIAVNCTLGASGKCDMAQSAIQAAKNLHSYWSVPYSQIELTPMIGGNDATDEVFTIADVTTMSTWVRQNGLAGVHFWSLDRDTDCAPGSASPTCNSYGSAGALGYTNAFITALGL